LCGKPFRSSTVPKAVVECQFGVVKHWIFGKNRGELGLAEVEVVEVVEIVEMVEVEMIEMVAVVEVVVMIVGVGIVVGIVVGVEVEVVEVVVEVDGLYYQLKRAAHSVYP
jgi:hypothetical protein